LLLVLLRVLELLLFLLELLLLVVTFYFPKLVATVRSNPDAVAGGVVPVPKCTADDKTATGVVADAFTRVVVATATEPAGPAPCCATACAATLLFKLATAFADISKILIIIVYLCKDTLICDRLIW
jgi:hypothetical protein